MNKIEEERALHKLRKAFRSKDTLICFQNMKKPNLKVIGYAVSRNVACLELPNCDHIEFTKINWLVLWHDNYLVINSKRMTPDMLVQLHKVSPLCLRSVTEYSFYRSVTFERDIGHLFTHETVKEHMQLLKNDGEISSFFMAKLLYRVSQMRNYEDCMVYIAIKFNGKEKLEKEGAII